MQYTLYFVDYNNKLDKKLYIFGYRNDEIVKIRYIRHIINTKVYCNFINALKYQNWFFQRRRSIIQTKWGHEYSKNLIFWIIECLLWHIHI